MNIEQIKAAGHMTTLNGLPGMSSQEIAEITGKKHLHVLRDIRKMIDALKINPDMDTSPKCVELQAPDAYGRPQPLTILDKELTFTLLSRYSFELANLIVKRWIVLEGSSFKRVTVQVAVAHLVESEKDNRRVALQFLKKGLRRPQTTEQKERQRLTRLATSEERKARQQGREYY